MSLPHGHLNLIRVLVVAVAALLLSGSAPGGVTQFNYYEEEAWWNAVGNVATITFTEVPPWTVVTDQYQELGIVFTDGNDLIQCCSKVTYPKDGAGLAGNPTITVQFATPQNWIAADFPGCLNYVLYNQGKFVGWTNQLGGGGYGFFGGLMSNLPFDEVLISDIFCSYVHIDDLHFGAALPGDANNDLTVDVLDLVQVIVDWGICPFTPENQFQSYCAGDVTGDDVVDVADLLEVILSWSP
jgi:hypothetical protein